jgi:hypothetical protein
MDRKYRHAERVIQRGFTTHERGRVRVVKLFHSRDEQK